MRASCAAALLVVFAATAHAAPITRRFNARRAALAAGAALTIAAAVPAAHAQTYLWDTHTTVAGSVPTSQAKAATFLRDHGLAPLVPPGLTAKGVNARGWRSSSASYGYTLHGQPVWHVAISYSPRGPAFNREQSILFDIAAAGNGTVQVHEEGLQGRMTAGPPAEPVIWGTPPALMTAR